MNKSYSVRPDGASMYVIVDMKTGAYVNRFHVPGELVNGPVVNNDSCTIVTQQHKIRTGYVIKIPTGYLMNRFSA